MRFNTVCCIFLICFYSCFNFILAQITTDTFKVAGTPVFINAAIEGTGLSNINECIDPYYHASAFIMSVVTFHIGKNVEIPVRIAAENQSFSKMYDDEDNFVSWIKPSIKAVITTVPLIDSINILAGDLWRIKHGQGLLLDNYEAHGITAKMSVKNFSIQSTWAGTGVFGWDDLMTFSLIYKNNFAVRYFNDYYYHSQLYPGSKPTTNYFNVISGDAFTTVNKNISIYTEGAFNTITKKKAALAGVDISYEGKRFSITCNAEFRHYENNFFTEGEKYQPYYIKSLTSLDKPLNSYIMYINNPKLSNTFSARIKGKLFLYKNFFVGADIEPILGDTALLAYESVIGFEAEKNVNLMFGIMNKFFVTESYGYYEYSSFEPSANMFYVRNKPWLMLKATFKF